MLGEPHVWERGGGGKGGYVRCIAEVYNIWSNEDVTELGSCQDH